jgi:hypothetical protein
MRERAWRGKSFTLDDIQQSLHGKTVPNPATVKALEQVRELDNWQEALDKSALGGTFRASQLKRIEQARAELQPELERLGYSPSTASKPGVDQPLTAAGIAKMLGLDKLMPAGTRVTGEVKGETTVTVKVEAGNELLRVVEGAKSASMSLSGTMSANGPGSLGTSSPDAAAMPVGGP